MKPVLPPPEITFSVGRALKANNKPVNQNGFAVVPGNESLCLV